MNVNSNPSLTLLNALRPTRATQGVEQNRTNESTTSSTNGAISRTLARPTTSVVAPTGELPAAATATAPEDLTVKGLLEVWGQPNEAYDLNADGTVNMADLVSLLSSQAKQHETPPPTEIQPRPELDTGTNLANGDIEPPPVVTEGTDLASTETKDTDPLPTNLAGAGGIGEDDPVDAERVTVSDLLAAWGTNQFEFDLNVDGTVDMADLVKLLGQLRTDTSGEGTDLVSGDPMTLRGLLESWGQEGSRYDLNADGSVNMRDLVDMLTQINSAREGGPGDRPGTSLAAGLAPDRGSLRPVANSLVQRLRDDGFESNPPSNIHRLVESLKLSTAHQKELMSHLDSEYPDGLGVNLVG